MTGYPESSIVLATCLSRHFRFEGPDRGVLDALCMAAAAAGRLLELSAEGVSFFGCGDAEPEDARGVEFCVTWEEGDPCPITERVSLPSSSFREEERQPR